MEAGDLRFGVLGALEVHRDGVAIPVSSPRQRSVLAALLAHAGRPTPPDLLIEAAWTDDLPQRPRAALSTVLSRLRRTLGTDAIQTEPTGYLLAAKPSAVDSGRFEDLVARAQETTTEAAIGLLDSALDLWRGQAYQEFADRDFAAAEATRLNELCLSCREELAERHLDLGDAEAAVVSMETVVCEHPLRERALGLLITALYRAGRGSAALDRYQGYRRSLAEDLGLEPSPALRELELRILNHDLPTRPVDQARVARAMPDLPVAVAAFVGRQHERTDVGDLVTAARIVTITGSGGCGKTRLAVEVARDVASRFPDGTRWVDLQGVNDPAMVARAVGAAVDVHEPPGRPLRDVLAEQLHARHLLVVLDNCEHLIQACAKLVGDLSPVCPRLHVLTTSREPLAVEGEATFGLGPLPVPEPNASSAAAVVAADATRLFEVRARQVRTDFRVDDDNAEAVADICRRLDGIPLAIELAAARVRVLSPRQIAAGLSDRFRLLTGGSRGLPARQETLKASLEWSYELLDEAERLALARLSVFAGSFELDAAEAVVGGDGIDREDVLDLVAALVEQSLLEVVERHGRARYRLLETIRMFASQQLSGLDEPARVHDRHVGFYVGLAERAQAGLDGAVPGPWLARLAADLDDLRAAMNWAAACGDLHGLVGITEPVVRFWFDRGLSGEVHRRLHDAVEALDTCDDECVRALMTAAALALACSEPASAYRSASEAVEAARATDVGDALAVASGQRAYSGVLSGLAADEQIDTDVEQALRHGQRCEDPSTSAYVLIFAGGALSFGRSIDSGRRTVERVVEVCETNALAFQLPSAHQALGLWPVWSGRLDETRWHARRAVDLSRKVGRPGWEAGGLAGLGAAALLQGDADRAHHWLSEAQAVVRSRGLGGSQYEMLVRPWSALMAYASGDLDTARDTAAEFARTARVQGRRWDEAFGEWLLGAVAQELGRHDKARLHLEASRALSTDPRLPLPLGRSLLGLADLARTEGDPAAAWELTHESLEILDEYGDHIGTAAALEKVAELSLAGAEPERALRLLAASQRFHTDMGITRIPWQDDRFGRARTAALAAVDLTEADETWDAGSVLSLADAVAYARRGRGERRRPPTGWKSLTPVELDVVRLAAEGCTNAEIGERLFISGNTVKKHLSHVYAKLEVDGRVELSALAARRDR